MKANVLTKMADLLSDNSYHNYDNIVEVIRETRDRAQSFVDILNMNPDSMTTVELGIVSF
jgi:hypothetical protein